MAGQYCRYCGERIVIMIMQNTGACCERHLDLLNHAEEVVTDALVGSVQHV